MFGQQITGQAFSSQYSVIFYQSQGFKSEAFLFNILANVSGLVCLIITWLIVDQVGRRPMLMVGGLGMAIFLFIVGGIGVVNDPTASQKNTLVRPRSLPRTEICGTDDLMTGCRFHPVYLCLQRILGAMVSLIPKP